MKKMRRYRIPGGWENYPQFKEILYALLPKDSVILRYPEQDSPVLLVPDSYHLEVRVINREFPLVDSVDQIPIFDIETGEEIK